MSRADPETEDSRAGEGGVPAAERAEGLMASATNRQVMVGHAIDLSLSLLTSDCK